MRFHYPHYDRIKRQNERNAYKVQITFDLDDAIHLAHDVLMGCAIHRTPDKDRKHAYQAKLLALTLKHNVKLWEPILKEIKHCWADTQIQRFINRLDEFVCTKDWDWPAERYAKAEAADQYAKDHPEGNSGTCIGHCCIYHGCKYGKEDCCVETGKAQQETPCEACGWEEDEEREYIERQREHRDQET